MRGFRRITVAALVAALAIVALVGPASAGGHGRGRGRGDRPARPAVTKITFRLDEHHVMLGEEVTGSVFVQARSGNRWVPLGDVVLSLLADGVEVGEIAVASDGTASVSHVADELGEHNLKVRYAGDAAHKRAHRAQGYEVEGAWYPDADGDGYGDPAGEVVDAEQPEGYVADATDCDDADAAVNPGAPEVPTNTIDDDCDGLVDEEA